MVGHTARMTALVSAKLTSDELLDQERRARFSTFSHQHALRLGEAMKSVGERQNLPIVVDVYAFGQQIFHAALPGTCQDNFHWVERKRNTVLRFAHSSLFMGVLCREKGASLEERYQLPKAKFASHGGSFPLFLEDKSLVGAATVSGLDQVSDHDLVVAAILDAQNMSADI